MCERCCQSILALSYCAACEAGGRLRLTSIRSSADATAQEANLQQQSSHAMLTRTEAHCPGDTAEIHRFREKTVAMSQNVAVSSNS
jgi:hypothetical protein